MSNNTTKQVENDSVTLSAGEYKKLLAHQNENHQHLQTHAKPNYALGEITIMFFGLIVVLAFTLPIRPILFLPVLLFALLGVAAFFSHKSETAAHDPAAARAILIFKVVAVIGISVLVTYGILVVLLLSS